MHVLFVIGLSILNKVLRIYKTKSILLARIPKMIGRRDINLNWILITVQRLLIVELYRYSCYGGQYF